MSTQPSLGAHLYDRGVTNMTTCWEILKYYERDTGSYPLCTLYAPDLTRINNA